MYNIKKDSHIWKGMEEHFKRFVTNIIFPFRVNPLSKGGNRKGHRDFVHSFVNLFVRLARLSPYHAGHLWCFTFVLMLLILILCVVF